MALVTVQRSPSPSDNPESDDGGGEEGNDEIDEVSLKSPGRQRRSKSALKRLKKFFHTVRFISKLRPCISESYFAVKGAALILPQSDCGDYTYTQKITRQRHAGQGAVTGDIQSHLQAMFYLLRSQDTIKVAVKVESIFPTHNRYMAVVSCSGKQDTEESVILGIDCNETATIGLVLPIWADTTVNLNGDGGFVISSENKEHIFKPVSVQAMWSALQSLNKVVKIARDNTYIPPGLTHTWVGYYKSRITSDRACITEWYTSEDLEEMRMNPIKIDSTGDPDQDLQIIIKSELKQIMMRVDLDEVTCKALRELLEEKLQMSLTNYKSFIDQEMLTILGQLDSPSMIKDYLYLGSEWNASNLEELTENGVDHILNISREVDNFFPEVLKYMNIKEWDNEEADMFKHWNSTNKFIAKARRDNSKVLVHCKMGISRSSSTVMAYLMKAYNMSRQEAFDYVKAIRPCVMPNNAFWKQLETYDGILNASRKRAMFKSKSEQNLANQPVKETVPEEGEPVEDFKFMKDDLYLPNPSKQHDPNDSVFIYDSNLGKETDLMFDIENSSRSADSTEESVDIPSPKFDGDNTGKFSSGNVHETDSSNASDADNDDAEVEGISAAEKKDFIPVDGSSEQPVSSSIGKYKADSSWIKESSTVEVVTPCDSVQVDEDKPSTDTSTEAVDSNLTVTEVKPIEASDCSEMATGVTGDSSEEIVVTPTGKVEKGVTQHYIKENIPWNMGIVKKQKQDFEEKAKEAKPIVICGDDSVPVMIVEGEHLGETSDDPQNCTEDTLSAEVSGEQCKDVEMKDTEDGDKKRPASVYDMEDIALPVGIVRQTTKQIEERNKQNDSSPESPTKPLQRSSSLRERSSSKRKRESDRRKTCMPLLSPSAPTSDESSSKEFVFPSKSLEINMDISSNFVHKQVKGDLTELCSGTGESGGIEVYKFGEEEVPVEKGIVKKQKMGIEQKSRDGKSTESSPPTPCCDFEKDILSSGRDFVKAVVQNDKVDSSCALGSVTSVPVDNSLSPKGHTAGSSQSAKMEEGSDGDTSTPKSGISEKSNKIETQHIDTKIVKENLSKYEQIVGANPCDGSVSVAISSRVGAKSAFTKERSAGSPTSPVAGRHKKKEDTDSRFDAETLELIREIGSAFLNSPVKTSEDKQTEEQKAEEGGSLVKFLVRNIEKNTDTAKKKHMKEIVIIDKDTQEKKKKPWKVQGSDGESLVTVPKVTESKQRPKLTTSLSSPSLVVPQSVDKELIVQDRKQKSFDGVSESSKDCSSANTRAMTQKSSHEADISDLACEAENSGKTEQGDDSAETIKVKNLVGKFELSDKQPSVKSTVLPPPAKQTKMLIIEQSPTDKNEEKPKLSSSNAAQSKSPKNAVATEESSSTSDDCRVNKEADKCIKDESDSDQSVELRNLRLNLRKPGTRPRSAEPIRSSSTSSGYFHEKLKLTHDHALPSPVEATFTWDGKKIRKLHGKTHPLSQLETRRKHSFYNTM